MRVLYVVFVLLFASDVCQARHVAAAADKKAESSHSKQHHLKEDALAFAKDVDSLAADFKLIKESLQAQLEEEKNIDDDAAPAVTVDTENTTSMISKKSKKQKTTSFGEFEEVKHNKPTSKKHEKKLENASKQQQSEEVDGEKTTETSSKISEAEKVSADADQGFDPLESLSNIMYGDE
eukprot:c20831_g1_i1.p1 GENE.c20831_g1_i1~~c20831_g1_i1.p1  ORF type:complete len:192 (-),score=76.42 c20831_g1_i1:118-654(-)